MIVANPIRDPELDKAFRPFKFKRLPKKERANVRRILNRQNHDPAKQLPLSVLVTRVVSLAQILLEKPFYAYQIALSTRIVESLLLHDGDVITSLMARQAGKTECIGGTCAAIALIFPLLANKYPLDWRLNLTDDQGHARGFSKGVKIGIYAPRLDQAGITFDRIKKAYETDSSVKILKEAGVTLDVNNGNAVVLSTGSRILCESASENSKIEGATHNLAVLEEAQDISDSKTRKSIHPMVAATMGSLVKIGTASTKKCDFYNAIQENRRMQSLVGKRNHFYFPWTVCAKYNSLYKQYIEKEMARLGGESDEFLMSYMGKWIFERGMFVSPDVLFHKEVALLGGAFSCFVSNGWLAPTYRHYKLVAGIDWGSTHDSTVLCLMAVDWKNPLESYEEAFSADGIHRHIHFKKHIVGWLEFRGDNYEHQFHEILAYVSRFPQIAKIVTDANTCGKPIYDRLCATFINQGIEIQPFNFSERVKSDGYKSLAGDLWTHRVTFPASPTARATEAYGRFVNQMLELRKEHVRGMVRVSHPDEKGAHDDYSDAMMMAAWGCNEPSNIGGEILSANPFFDR